MNSGSLCSDNELLAPNALTLADDVDEDYWYENRHDLWPGQVFRDFTGNLVKLDRQVPGDATQWYVADWNNGWAYCDGTIEPGDLRSHPLPEPVKT